MQSVKFFMRQIGIPGNGVQSVEEVQDELEYKLLSLGYVVSNSHYLGDVKDTGGNVVGYKVMLVLTKEDGEQAVAPKAPKTLKGV